MVLPSGIREGLTQLAESSAIQAMQDTLLVMGALILLMFLISTFLPKREERELTPEDRVPMPDAELHSPS